MPLVSVVLCTYNQRDFLVDAVESVLHQTHPRMELLLIDNGSTDGTTEVLERYAGRENVRILAHRENGPINRRMNEGLAASRGDYVSVLYGDDYYLPEKTARQLACFKKLPPEFGVVYGPGYRHNLLTGRKWIDSRANATGGLREILRIYDTTFINPISPLIRRECFERYPYHEDIFTTGEGHFVILALSYEFFYLDEPLVVMREHDRNVGKAYLRNFECSMALLEKLEAAPQFPRHLVPRLAMIRATSMTNLGWQLVRLAGDPISARYYFFEAAKRERRQLLRPRAIIGLAMSLLPPPLLRAVNSLFNLVRRHRVSTAYREDYR